MTQLSTGLSAKIIVASGKIWRWQLQLIQSLEEQGLINVRDVISDDGIKLSPIKPIHVAP